MNWAFLLFPYGFIIFSGLESMPVSIGSFPSPSSHNLLSWLKILTDWGHSSHPTAISFFSFVNYTMFSTLSTIFGQVFLMTTRQAKSILIANDSQCCELANANPKLDKPWRRRFVYTGCRGTVYIKKWMWGGGWCFYPTVFSFLFICFLAYVGTRKYRGALQYSIKVFFLTHNANASGTFRHDVKRLLTYLSLPNISGKMIYWYWHDSEFKGTYLLLKFVCRDLENNKITRLEPKWVDGLKMEHL